ncbi:MAG: leucine-rich repeat domain-containing protein [Lachnospiraceae bacterium]|nr:leucine-rich repeat domain-containing protein [Lachnospiraceae bacterium]
MKTGQKFIGNLMKKTWNLPVFHCMSLRKNVRYLGMRVFGSVGKTEIVVDPKNPYLKKIGNLLLIDGGDTIYRYLGSGRCSCFIPNGIKKVDEMAFEGTCLTKIQIPNSVKVFGAKIFPGCGKLISVKLPDGMNILPFRTFEGCTSLAQVMLPGRLKVMEAYVFYNCSSLYRIEIPKNTRGIGELAFKHCVNLLAFTYSPKLALMEKEAFAGCTALEHIDFCGSSPVIQSDVFKDTPWLKNHVEKITELENAQCEKGILPGIDPSYHIVGTKVVYHDEQRYFEEELGLLDIPHEVACLETKPYEFIDEISLNLNEGKLYRVQTWYGPRGEYRRLTKNLLTETDTKFVLSHLNDPKEKELFKHILAGGGKELLLKNPKYRTIYARNFKCRLPFSKPAQVKNIALEWDWEEPKKLTLPDGIKRNLSKLTRFMAVNQLKSRSEIQYKIIYTCEKWEGSTYCRHLKKGEKQCLKRLIQNCESHVDDAKDWHGKIKVELQFGRENLHYEIAFAKGNNLMKELNQFIKRESDYPF